MRSLACISLGVLSLPALAGPGTGSVFTTGPTSDHHSVYAGVLNPALGELMVPADEHFRLGFTPSLTTLAEVGQVDNFAEELDDLIDLIDDPTSSSEPVQNLLDRFNSVLNKMGDEGYIKNTTALHFPVMPLYWKLPLWDGTLMADLNIGSQALARVLDAPLSYDEQNQSFTTASAAYLKGATQTAFALGYSRGWFDSALVKEYGGQLYAGVKLAVYSVKLSKQVFLLQKLDGKDISDVISDEYDRNSQSTTAPGVDLGVIWVTDDYRLGATLYNINQPSFDYGVLGENCTSRLENSVERANCEAAADFAQVRGDIKARESHKKSAYITLDGSYYWLPNAWSSASLDLAAYDDFVGTQNQWFYLSSEYQPATTWLPNVRGALQKNLAGSKLTQMALGIEFKGISLDVSFALDKTKIDGSQLPRSLGFSLAIAEQF